MSTASLSPDAARALLDWYVANGIDTAEGAAPSDFSTWPDRPFRIEKAAPPPRPAPRAEAVAPAAAPSPDLSADEAITAAREAADAAGSIAELTDAIRAFDGCPLKSGARNTVVYDGIEGADLLIIGEAPGRDEDRIGKPFVGRAGQLLDRMLAAIGRSRVAGDDLADACITNAIYWRPPGNRTPTEAERQVCLPFVRRFIELSAPRVIMLTGNVSTQSLFPGAPGITRSRGQWREWPGPNGSDIPVLPVFHPAYLLRSPGQKRLAWSDLLLVSERLRQN